MVVLRYYSIYTGPPSCIDGKFTSSCIKLTPDHLKYGYWRFDTHGPNNMDEKAFQLGYNLPEEVLFAAQRGQHETNSIILHWIPSQRDPDQRSQVGNADQHLEAIERRRSEYGITPLTPGVLPMYPMPPNEITAKEVPALPEKCVARAQRLSHGIAEGCLINDLGSQNAVNRTHSGKRAVEGPLESDVSKRQRNEALRGLKEAIISQGTSKPVPPLALQKSLHPKQQYSSPIFSQPASPAYLDSLHILPLSNFEQTTTQVNSSSKIDQKTYTRCVHSLHRNAKHDSNFSGVSTTPANVRGTSARDQIRLNPGSNGKLNQFVRDSSDTDVVLEIDDQNFHDKGAIGRHLDIETQVELEFAQGTEDRNAKAPTSDWPRPFDLFSAKINCIDCGFLDGHSESCCITATF
ncbi:hypothetical protein AOQ84DRAFT_228965 [Glonium stellatum]|uniref:Uncharacterized protein n=1 Tax=Glonium stellatum TaxID=574774 RepID=A0A8E2JMC0_9PEZI|nr:hypothetical protein AOQ84DRAFT_228965 [Glonium stellatum]